MGKVGTTIFSLAAVASAAGTGRVLADEILPPQNHVIYEQATEACADFLPLAGPMLDAQLPVACQPFINDFQKRAHLYLLPSHEQFVTQQRHKIARSDLLRGLMQNTITGLGGAAGLIYAVNRSYLRRQAAGESSQNAYLPVSVHKEGTDSRMLTKPV